MKKSEFERESNQPSNESLSIESGLSNVSEIQDSSIQEIESANYFKENTPSVSQLVPNKVINPRFDSFSSFGNEPTTNPNSRTLI